MLDTCGETLLSVCKYCRAELSAAGVNITNLLAGFIKLLWLAGGLFGSLIDPIFSFFINIFVCAKRTRILTLARCDKIIRSSNYSRVSGAGGSLHRPPHLCIGITGVGVSRVVMSQTWSKNNTDYLIIVIIQFLTD